MVDVLEHRMASSRINGSIRPNRCCFGSGCSMIASTTMSEWQSSISDSVPFTRGANSIARLASGPLVCLLKATSFNMPCTPRMSASWLASITATGMPRFTLAAAMPWPITPAPTTPAVAIFFGSTFAATPASFLLRSRRKKTFSSARLIGEPKSLANSSASIWQAVSASTPAAESMSSKAASGAG